MNPYRYTAPADEKPLEHMVKDGGYTSIFRTIACVGDSMASGEFETFDPETKEHHFYDMFPYSWGQYIARMAGCTVHNFSRGGMTAMEYCKTYAEEKGWWDPALAAQAYIVGMGANDLFGLRQPLGEMSDIHPEDPEQNADTFTGWFARLIMRYKAIQPDAKFFLLTMPREDRGHGEDHPMSRILADYAARIRELAEYFDNTYVIDLHTYAPPQDKDYFHLFYLHGHMSPMGYRVVAEQICSYMDYIIRHNPRDFVNVPFIGKGIM